MTDPNNPWIVSSQIKGANPSIQYMIDKFMNNEWDSKNESLGVSDGAIGAVWATQDSVNPRSSRLSDADVAYLKEVVKKLASGEIDMRTMPTEPEDLNQLIPLIGR